MSKLSETIKNLWLDFVGEENLDEALGDGVFPTAREYMERNVSPAEYLEWYAIGGWDIERMLELEKCLDIDFYDLGDITDKGGGGYSHTIAYKYCNGDLSLDEILEILD